MNTPTPHYYRRQSIHTVILLLIAIIVFIVSSCTPKHGCYSPNQFGIIKKNVSKDGISVIYVDNKDTFALDYLTRKECDSLQLALIKKSGYAWLRGVETKKVFVLDSVGEIVCHYSESK